MGDLASSELLTLRARQTDNWGHASLNSSKKKNDFVALWRSDAHDEHIYGVRRFDVSRLLSPMRLSIPCENNAVFDVAFLQNYKRSEYSSRFRCYKYRSRSSIDGESRQAFSVEDIAIIFRPVHMTPQWDEDTTINVYLNPKTDLHAWMNFY